MGCFSHIVPVSTKPSVRLWFFIAISTVLIGADGCFEYVVRGGGAGGTQTGNGLAIIPATSCVVPAGTQQFTATSLKRRVAGVEWYVDGIRGGNAGTGSISADGLYGAPAMSGMHVVKAVSTATPVLTASASISVTGKANLMVDPANATVPPNGKQTFKAQSCGAPADQVDWLVDDIPGGNGAVGFVSTGGEYTAPAVAGTHTLKAMDRNSSRSSTALVTVGQGIVVDFGQRAPNANVIPAGVLGINRVDWLQDLSAEQLVAKAGFKLSRSYANIPSVFESRKPDWTKIDEQISEMQSAGFHVLLQLSFTPKWLQPRPNPCKADPTTAAPRDVNAWAAIAGEMVAHIDEKFPGVVTDYEIWNEPDTGGMCGTKDRLKTYLALYAAAAPIIKQQAAADGATVRVGGPAISSPKPNWISALATSPETAPYVDFISYHDYIGGTNELDAKWDENTGLPSLYEKTQDSKTGAAAVYIKASNALKTHGTKPVYIDEFNTNWAFSADCCRDDPTYAPVWNALYVSDVLNTVYWAGTRVPGQLTYYSANTHPYFCIVGNLDAAMDCDLSPDQDPAPYPQYFAYQLMASGDYLGMNQGGYMAASVSPMTHGAGLAATAFFNTGQDSILIVNPTANSYSEGVTVMNSGFSGATATLFQVVNGNSITSAPLPARSSSETINMNVMIPPYSVIGIVLK